jgi:hypothetical protein
MTISPPPGARFEAPTSRLCSIMKMEFDYTDGLLAGAVFLGASVMAGIGSFDLFGVAFTDTALQVGEGLTVAGVLVVGAFVGTILTNDNTDLGSVVDDVQDLEQKYYLAVAGSAALLVAWVFVPDVSSFVQSSDLWGVAYVTGTMVAQVALGWML